MRGRDRIVKASKWTRGFQRPYGLSPCIVIEREDDEAKYANTKERVA